MESRRDRFMHASREFVKIDKFDGANYSRWQEKVKFLLRMIGLWYILDTESIPEAVASASVSENNQPTSEEIRQQEAKKFLRKEEEEICLGYIKHSLSDRLYDLYSTVACPKELWKTLENKYKAQEAGTNKYLISKYLEFQMFPNKPILEQVQNLQVIVNKLKAVDVIIPEIFQVGAIIAKLPSTWKDFSRKMMHKTEDYSMEELQLHLRIEEEARSREAKSNMQESSVHNVKAVSSRKKFGGPQSSRKVGGLGANKTSFKIKVYKTFFS